MTEAAFFDLDRTLVPGASGPAFSRALRQVGVLPERAIPGEGAVYKLFDLIGETLPSMFLARQAARAAKGWRVQQVREAGELAAEELDGAVPGFARLAVAQHRAEGRKVVVATTSPIDLVRPLAEVLGADELIATTYGVRNGCYDGTIDGRFVWGPGKLGAVRDWAAVNGVAVEESWAYSDSFYDFPLLNAVGTPIVVNPDPRLRLLAAARRWPVVHFDVPQRVPKVVGIEPQMVAQAIGRSPLFPWVHWDIDGTDNIPLTGPAILVANHRSYFDPLAVGRTVSEIHRPVRFLSKKEVLEAPVVGLLVASFGTIPVDRGSGSDEPLLAAAKALEAGEVVALMPQGTIPRGRALYDPELKGRWGAARLATLSKAPVVPIGLWGTEAVWPRNRRYPDVLALGHPPVVRVRVGPPVELKYRSVDADTKRIMTAIRALLPPEAEVVREPTAEEIARAMPAGHSGDADGETDRRPGSD